MASKEIHITIIGAGNIGLSIADGLYRSSYPVSHVTLTRRNLSALNDYAAKGFQLSNDNQAAVKNADLVVIAVKPYFVEKILDEIRSELREDATVVSVASQVSIEKMVDRLNPEIAVYRAMPGIGASIQESATCVAGNTNDDRFHHLEKVFQCIGEVIPVDEQLMEAATVLGACGVAYVLRFMRAMIQGGIQIGFDAKTATRIVEQTVRSAAGITKEEGIHPEAAIDRVTTPRGCTIVGLNEMEHAGFSSALIKGIVASFDDIKQ